MTAIGHSKIKTPPRKRERSIYPRRSPGSPRSAKPRGLRWAPALVKSVHSFRAPPPSMKSSLWWHQVPAKQTQSELVLLEPGSPIQIGQAADSRERIDVTFATLTEELLRDIQKGNLFVQLRFRRKDDDNCDFFTISEKDLTGGQWFTYAYLSPSKPASNVRIGLPSGSYEFEYRMVSSNGRVSIAEKEGHGVYISFLYSGMTMKNV